MSRIYNFSAGPAMLPEEVLKTAAEEMLDYHGCGMSVMEMSHRSKVYQGIIDEAEADLRKLIGIPDNYKVLFLQGGATLGFPREDVLIYKTHEKTLVVFCINGVCCADFFKTIIGDESLMLSTSSF